MKKILVFSDSHNFVEDMISVTQKERPDMIFHLGDCLGDARELQRLFPEIIVESVPGNCDYEKVIDVRLLTIENHTIMLCHGHQYHVKDSYLSLEYAALEKGADIVLFGHTHKIHYDCHNGLWILNPGSISRPYYSSSGSYGILKIDGEKVSIDTRFV